MAKQRLTADHGPPLPFTPNQLIFFIIMISILFVVLFITAAISFPTEEPKLRELFPNTESLAAGNMGDINSDLKVDIFDLGILAAHYGTNVNTNSTVIIKACDLNNSGKIDVFDLGLLMSVYGRQYNISPTPTSPPTSCTIDIPSNVTTIDGTGNYATIKPGDTLCLIAGNRGELTIQNLNGERNNLITIKNSGNSVIIQGQTTRAGINIENSSYLRITGSGSSNECGSLVTDAQQKCGIEIKGTDHGIEIKSDGATSNVEIDHITIHDTNPAVFDTGIGIHPQQNRTLTNFYLHHNYIYNTGHEGFYIGSDPNKPTDDNGKLENVEISYNLVKHTGFDGINVKQSSKLTKIHHNILIDTGWQTGSVDHVPEGGIQMASCSEVEVFNNLIVDSHDTGINLGRAVTTTGNKYYNNIVVGSVNEGINLGETNALVFNNTVVNNKGGGIIAGNNEVFDNAVIGSGGTPIRGNATNNYTGTLQSAGFSNPSAHDYSLIAGSPLINAGRNTGTFPPLDYAGTSRPQGAKTDIGAYEYK